MVIIWFLLQARDLQIIMRYLEHWAHRLFPKMPFDEVLERIEKLGTKNEVKVRLSGLNNILFTTDEMQFVYTTTFIYSQWVTEMKLFVLHACYMLLCM